MIQAQLRINYAEAQPTLLVCFQIKSYFILKLIWKKKSLIFVNIILLLFLVYYCQSK